MYKHPKRSISLAAVFFLTASFAASPPIADEQLPGIGDIVCIDGRHEAAGNAHKVTIAKDKKECTLKFGLPTADLKIYDEMELEIKTANPDTAVTLELFLSKPQNGLLLQKTFKLKQGTHTYRFPLAGAGLSRIPAFVKLTMFNKADNTHVPESVMTEPVEIMSLKLIAAGTGLDTTLLEVQYPELPSSLRRSADTAVRQLKAQFSQLETKLKRTKKADEKRALLESLYELQQNGTWRIEQKILGELLNSRAVVHGAANGIDKIFRQRTFPGRLLSDVRIATAQNETEGAQAVLFSGRDLKDVSVECTALTSPKNHRIETDKIFIAPVGYIQAPEPAYLSEMPSQIPDPLMADLKTFDIEAGHYQPVWVEVSVPAGQAPGVYSGQLVFREGGKELLTVPLEVKVWNFQLPDNLSFPVAIVSDFRFSSRSGQFGHFYGTDATLDEARKYMFSENPDKSTLSPEGLKLVELGERMVDVFQKHRIPNDHFYRSLREPVPGWQRREHRDSRSYFSLGYDNAKNPIEILAPQVKAMKEEGSLPYAYVYGNDEIRTQKEFDRMRESYGEIKKNFPELKTMCTALDYTCGIRTGTSEVVDIWVMPSPNYMGMRKAAEAARARGKQVWWYPCNWPYPPTANLLLENTGTASRLMMGFMPWKFDVDGFLYYATTMWTHFYSNSCVLKNWEKPVGDTVRTKDTGRGPNNEYRMTATPQTHARLWQWSHLNQKAPSPLTIGIETEVERFQENDKTSFQIVLDMTYTDKSKKKVVFPLDRTPHQWKTEELRVEPEKPVAYYSYTVDLSNADALVHVRNVRLLAEGNSRVVRKRVTVPLQGGPLVTMQEYPNTFLSNGDGALMLPGEHAPIQTIRLKYLRDGLEDYEYLVMLKSAIGQVKAGRAKVPDAKRWLDKAEQCLSISDRLCKNLNQYTGQGSDVLEKRAEIAELLEQLNQ